MIQKTVLAFAALLLLGIGATSPAAYADSPISACGPITAPGTYTVTTNITAPPSTNCITISASSVAIDLAGHTITGSGFSSGIIGSGQNIIVANGTITGFNQNVNLASFSYVTVSNVKAINGGFSGINVGGDYAIVTDSTATNNGAFGIYFQGSNNTVSNTKANNNGTGVAFFFSNNTVSASQTNGNVNDGMYFDKNSGNTVSDSQANGNGSNGMEFAAGGGTITDSQANNNVGDGILAGGPGNLLTSNTAQYNGGVGISVVCPSNLYGNSAKGNTGGNIVTSGTPACTRLDNKPAP